MRLRGGAKKRKKKSYTTPKKNKHKRKKVKLAVLKYYKVSQFKIGFNRLKNFACVIGFKLFNIKVWFFPV